MFMGFSQLASESARSVERKFSPIIMKEGFQQKQVFPELG
jgi:hypothetical protein